ncbi:MAG TPA: tetratricopeptide repeat protein, partial [Thermoanaerobaculaceae bacterium]|nr:tetratricopeptide repeat protein [Thermoanaerobaculaceae bacterium]
GYHLVNILIHAAAGLALFGCLRGIMTGRGGSHEGVDTTAAFAVSLLWLLHPLQTEAVTYISQRAESLMGLFFILSVHAAVRGFGSTRPTPWFRWAAFASLLSVLAKEVGVVAPVVVLVYDSYFVSDGVHTALKRHRRLYAGLTLTWVAAAFLQLSGPRGYSVSLTNETLSPLGYLQRQVVGILMYLKLAVWPSPLVFDYGFPPPVPPLGTTIVAGAVLAGMAVVSFFLVRRRLLVGFAGIAFFVILAPSSSVIPILTEVLAEHRMYLPLSCVLGVLVGGAFALIGHWQRKGWLPATRGVGIVGWAILALTGSVLGVLTYQRNAVYHSEMSLWRDTVAKGPPSPRAQSNLGVALMEAGRVDDALTHFREALSMNPEYFEANGNMAVALERLGRPEEALPYMLRAVRRNQGSVLAWERLVRLLGELGRWDEAAAAALDYVKAFPSRPDANSACAVALLRAGRKAEALPFMRRAKELEAATKAGSGTPR